MAKIITENPETLYASIFQAKTFTIGRDFEELSLFLGKPFAPENDLVTFIFRFTFVGNTVGLHNRFRG